MGMGIVLSILFLLFFRNEIRKIMRDTLTNNGKYSRKSLQMFSSFIICTVMGFIIIYRNQVNDSAIQVFYGFLGMAGGMAILTVWDKLKGNNTNT
jgi:TctA family transporter